MSNNNHHTFSLTCISARGFDERRFARRDITTLFRFRNHAKSNAILDTVGRIVRFQLGNNVGHTPFRHLVQSHQRRISH